MYIYIFSPHFTEIFFRPALHPNSFSHLIFGQNGKRHHHNNLIIKPHSHTKITRTTTTVLDGKSKGIFNYCFVFHFLQPEDQKDQKYY